MSEKLLNPTTLQLVAPFVSLTVGVAALLLSLRSERRNQVRFQHQLDLSRRIAEANVRPLLGLTTNAYEDKRLELSNHGTGTAVIRSLVFRRGRKAATSVPDILDLPAEVVWDDFADYEGPFEHFASATPSLEGVKIRKGEYITSMLSDVMMDAAIMSDLIESYQQKCLGKSTIDGHRSRQRRALDGTWSRG